jgi:hypothetical protein
MKGRTGREREEQGNRTEREGKEGRGRRRKIGGG